MKNTVAAIVVTYNRKELLLECLSAVRKQTRIPNVIYIIDNLSTDGTPEMLFENDYIPTRPEFQINENQKIESQVSSLFNLDKTIKIKYTRKFQNDGGAGGFYEGMKQAYEEGFDWVWIMDDDGKPDQHCLKNLTEVGDETILYVAPNLIDSTGESHFSELFNTTRNRVIPYKGGPFNAILINRRIIEDVGYPIRKFFIWGDETEFLNRIMEAGYIVATVKDAVHHHPRTSINYSNNKRLYYLVRNYFISARFFKGIYKSKLSYWVGAFYIFFKTLINLLKHVRLRAIIDVIRGAYNGLTCDLSDYKKE